MVRPEAKLLRGFSLTLVGGADPISTDRAWLAGTSSACIRFCFSSPLAISKSWSEVLPKGHDIDALVKFDLLRRRPKQAVNGAHKLVRESSHDEDGWRLGCEACDAVMLQW